MKNRTLNEIMNSKEYKQAVELSARELKGENFYKNPFYHADVDKTVETIVEKLDGHMYDLIFQAVCD